MISLRRGSLHHAGGAYLLPVRRAGHPHRLPVADQLLRESAGLGHQTAGGEEGSWREQGSRRLGSFDVVVVCVGV